MEVQKDYKELLELFNRHKVEYMIVGAYALAYHGVPRFTGDIDIFVHPSPGNAKNILSALADFGFGSLNLTIDDFQIPNSVVQLGVPPVRIDIITSITGVTWEEANMGKSEGTYYYVIANKYIINEHYLIYYRDLNAFSGRGTE
jgi:hypothetical protein